MTLAESLREYIEACFTAIWIQIQTQGWRANSIHSGSFNRPILAAD